MTHSTAPAIATRRMVWFDIHHLILDRSLPVPRNVSLLEHIRCVSLYFDDNGEADRWGVCLGLGDVEFDPDGDHMYYGERDGWRWNIRCIPVRPS